MVDRPRSARRGFRELPGATTRVRGAGALPYNPQQPLRLPGNRGPRRPPQLRLSALLRGVLLIAALGGLGVGVFFAADALVDGDGDQPVAGATPDTAAAETAVVQSTIESETPAADQSAAPAATDQTAAPADVQPESPAPTILTPADLGSAPVLVERGAATPVPPGLPDRTLDDGAPYDPTDEALALSSVWLPGTTLELVRLPGGPLLSDEDAALLIGQSIRVVVRAAGSFPTELQLSPAAYRLLARDFEPIIAVRIEAVAAPPR